MPAIAERTVVSPVRVVVADDHAGFRATARDLIAATPRFVAVGEAASGECAVAVAAQTLPDLVLIDVNMPGIGGIEALSRIREAGSAHVLALVSIDASERLPPTAWRCGATAVLDKRLLRPSLLLRLWTATRDAPAPDRPLTAAELASAAPVAPRPGREAPP